MKKEKGFILMTVLIVVFALSTLALMRLLLSGTRTAELVGYTQDLKLLYIAESGIKRVQAAAHDTAAAYALNNIEYPLGEGSYIINSSLEQLPRIVTVSAYLPNAAHKRAEKNIVITGSSITSNYLWQEN